MRAGACAAAISSILCLVARPTAAAQNGDAAMTLNDLLDRGFEVIAEGQLLEAETCRRLTLRVLHESPSRELSCTTRYGTFQRVKREGREFVCISFRGWTCFQSESGN
jgi:hypothetical protein